MPLDPTLLTSTAVCAHPLTAVTAYRDLEAWGATCAACGADWEWDPGADEPTRTYQRDWGMQDIPAHLRPAIAGIWEAHGW